MDLVYSVVAVALAYLIGSVSFAVLVSRLMGLPDPHSYGSGNPGATNVLRTGRRSAAILTLLGDAGKGVIAVLLARALAMRFGFGEATVAAVGLAVFVGHLYPAFHGFKGGKGVATAAGVLLAASPWLGGVTLLAWVLIAYFFRYSSLASLVASVCALFYQGITQGLAPMTVVVGVMSALLILRHRRNIANLMAGKESRIGQKSAR